MAIIIREYGLNIQKRTKYKIQAYTFQDTIFYCIKHFLVNLFVT